jgi:hypothetical protein
LDRLTAGSCLVAYLPSGLLFKERPQVVPDRWIVIYYKNSNQGGTPLLSQVMNLSFLSLNRV